MKRMIFTAAMILALSMSSVAVWADDGEDVKNTAENETNNVKNTAKGGNAKATGGNASNTNNIKNTATGGQGGNATIQKGAVQNTNTNSNSLKNTQSQTQSQTQSIKNSGNSSSSSSSSATGGSVKNSGNSSSSSKATGGSLKNSGNSSATGGSAANSGVSQSGDNVRVYAAPPSMGVASLVAAPETCMGSTSASLTGGNGMVGAGIGFGKTYESANCNRRMNARYLITLGMPEAALLLLAQDADVRKALDEAGVELPHKAAAAKVDGPTVSQPAEPVKQDTETTAPPSVGPGFNAVQGS